LRLHPYLEFGGPIAFALRGGALEAPENSMRAFEACMRQGYTYLATDAQATADGVLIAFKDDTLERVTDLRGPVAPRSYADLSAARVSGTEPIARLDEIISSWPAARINIDLRSDSAIEPLSRLISDLSCIDRICLASRSAARLNALRGVWGDKLCTALAPRDFAPLMLAMFNLPVGKLSGRCVQVSQRVTLGGLSRPLVDGAFLHAAHKHNIPVYVVSVDERAQMEHLIGAGVDGVMTGRPSLLKQVLEDQGLWWDKAPRRDRKAKQAKDQP
jgi:glycerophosphoryl diester phosphodiesterase